MSVGVVVDGVHGADERAEPVEDHDDAADDVVVEEDLKRLGRVRIAAAECRDQRRNDRDHDPILRRTPRFSSASNRTSPAARSAAAKSVVRTSTGFQRTAAF